MSFLRSGRLSLMPLTLMMLGACAVAPANQDAKQDNPGSVDEAIHGGQLETSYPAVGYVSFSDAAGNGFACTGTLISPEVVLTAKHCLGNSMQFFTGTSGSNFVGHVVDKTFGDPGNDVGLLHLASPIRDIRPMDINVAPPSTGIADIEACTAVGFGRHREANGMDSSGVKRSALVTAEITAPFGLVPSTIGVTWNTGIPDHGDSGGPLLCNGVIVGVASKRSGGSDPGIPDAGIYARLNSAWITNVAADYSSEPTSSWVSWGPNRLDGFIRGTNGETYHKYREGSAWSSGFESLGGFSTGTPEAVSWGPLRIDVFVRGGDMALYHKYFDGNAGGGFSAVWEPLGGFLSAHPSVVSWGANRLDIFGVASDGAMYHKAYTGSAWTDWEGLGGSFKGTVKAVSWGAGRLDVFAIGTDSKLYHKWFDKNWGPSKTDWESLDGGLVGQISAVTSGPNRIDVIGKGLDGAAYHRAFTPGGWFNWDNFGGSFIGSPVVTSWGPNRLDFFGQGTDGHLYHNFFQGGLGTWESLSGGLAGSPVALSRAANTFDVFLDGTEFALYHKGFGPQWIPSFDGFDNLGGTLSW